VLDHLGDLRGRSLWELVPESLTGGWAAGPEWPAAGFGSGGLRSWAAAASATTSVGQAFLKVAAEHLVAAHEELQALSR